MADLETKRGFVVVEDLEKTITAESHLASLLDVNTLGPGHLIGENQTPMVRITYEDLDLSGIEAAYKTDKGLLPLRNFLVWKKKGVDKSKCAFGLYCVTTVSNENKAIYYLQLEKNLYEKVKDNNRLYPNVFVFGKIKICGLAQEPVESGMGYMDRTFGLNREDTKSTFIITKEGLQNQAGNKIITFQFTVKFDCTPHWGWNKESFSIGSAETESVLRKMYDLPDSSKDVTIVAEDGAEVKAHKVILMAHSPVFCSMLNSDNATAEAQSGRILMEENSEEGLTQLIRYLYGISLKVDALSPDLALEVFQMSHKYGLKALEGDMMTLLIEKGIEWYSVDCMLELYFYVKNIEDLEELKAHALTEMADGLSEEDLMTCDFFKSLDEAERLKLVCTLWNWSRIKI